VSNGNQLLRLAWADGTTSHIATVAPELNGLERFNDGKCDPKGRVFIGTVLESSPGGAPVVEGGSLYTLQGSTFIKQSTGFTITNGMAWSNDPLSKHFYLNDSEGRKIYIFNYDLETGTLCKGIRGYVSAGADSMELNYNLPFSFSQQDAPD